MNRVPLLFVTSSRNKFAEAIRLSPLPLERADMDLPEPQELDVATVVRAKGAAAWELIQKPLIVEDTSLELTALGGFPGPLIKWLLAASGPPAVEKILAGYDDRRATAKTAIAYADSKGLLIVNGSVDGTIVAPRGDRGFGWDSVFQPDGSSRTFGEMEPAEKSLHSHRARAFAHLEEALRARQRRTGEYIPVLGGPPPRFN